MNCNLHYVAHKLICLSAMLMKFMEISGGSQGGSQSTSQGRSSSARSFDLAFPGVAPPLSFHYYIMATVTRCYVLLAYWVSGKSYNEVVVKRWSCTLNWTVYIEISELRIDSSSIKTFTKHAGSSKNSLNCSTLMNVVHMTSIFNLV